MTASKPRSGSIAPDAPARGAALRRGLAALAAAALLSGCYSLEQAFRFNNLYNGRRKVEDVIGDAREPAELREKLGWSRDILRFAQAQGLNADGAYGHYVATGDPVVSWLVQASEADRFESVTWWFPFVGRVPYLGYFSKRERDAQAEALEAKGYDVARAGVGAFSSLGWFEDPIYTSMLNNDRAGLAHLLLHELVHRTFWSRGSVEFNENLAEFFGIRLMERYLRERGLEAALAHDRLVREDRRKLTEWVKALKTDLESLYAKGPELGRAKVLAEKSRIIGDYMTRRMPTFATEDYAYVTQKTWNNAAILGASLYLPDTEAFEKAFACYGRDDVGGFLSQLAAFEKDVGDAPAALGRFCASVPPATPRSP